LKFVELMHKKTGWFEFFTTEPLKGGLSNVSAIIPFLFMGQLSYMQMFLAIALVFVVFYSIVVVHEAGHLLVVRLLRQEVTETGALFTRFWKFNIFAGLYIRARFNRKRDVLLHVLIPFSVTYVSLLFALSLVGGFRDLAFTVMASLVISTGASGGDLLNTVKYWRTYSREV